MKSRYYSDDALSVRFFDSVTSIDPSVAGDVDFYTSYLHSPAQQVLEIGCGTGRVAIALAARGHLVIGIDNSEPMLKRARLKSRNLAPSDIKNVQFLRYDMLTLDLPARFGLVIVPYYTFNHLKTRTLRGQCLSTIAKHLLPGSRAIIHAAPPEMLGKPRTTRKHVFNFFKDQSHTDPSARLEVTWRPRSIDEKQRKLIQIVEYELFSADNSVVAASAERLTLWWFSDFELEMLARKVGLEHERTLTSFSSESGNERIYVLRKPL